MTRLRQGFMASIVLIGVALTTAVYAKTTLMIPGAGPSTRVVAVFFEHFASTTTGSQYDYVVPPRSIKHAGGIAASDELIFGRTGRPLSQAEKGTTKDEIILARIPLTFVVGQAAGVKRMSLAELRGIISGKITNWKELGGSDHPIELVGRERTEAAFSAMRDVYPFLGKARFSRIFTRDHQVMNFIQAPEGAYAFSFGAAPNFDHQSRLDVEGFSVGVQVGLVYDLRNADHDLIVAVRHFSNSEAWRRAVGAAGFLPPS